MNPLRPDAIVDYQDELVAVIRHDARDLPLEDESVDLIVTSPPYFALRSYRDDGEHYDGQIGSEDTPDLFLDALDECMVEWGRVLKPSGSIFVNLGDKYAGGQPHSDWGSGPLNHGAGVADSERLARQDADLDAEPVADFGGFRTKSLMGLPWRFAIRQIDNGWILRAEVVWDKPNGLPESVTDRVRRSHETWFHMVKEPRYFSGVDEIREPHLDTGWIGRDATVDLKRNSDRNDAGDRATSANLLGRLPGSVWTIPGSRDMVVVTLEAWRSANGLCPTCGKTPTRAVGNGQAGETTAVMGKAPATSNPEAKTGHTESPTDSISDPSPTDSPSTTSAETEAASTQTTSKQSLSKSTSAAAKKPTEPTASTATPSPTPTSTGAADTNDENAESAISDVCECADSGTPRSVWTVPSEPLLIQDATRQLLDLPDHFAAFPQEFPRRIIQGWSPTGICVECGEGRRPVMEALSGETKEVRKVSHGDATKWAARFRDICQAQAIDRAIISEATGTSDMYSRWTTRGNQPEVPLPHQWEEIKAATDVVVPNWMNEMVYRTVTVPVRFRTPRDVGGGIEQYSNDLGFNPAERGISGYACACPTPDAPTRLSVICDPFGGTGTVAGVAKTLGRYGISNDLSASYNRLAIWRITQSGHFTKTEQRSWADRQGQLL